MIIKNILRGGDYMPSPAPSPVPVIFDEVKNILKQIVDDEENKKMTRTTETILQRKRSSD